MKQIIDWNRTIKLAISDRKPPVEKALKCAEETGELAEAVLSHLGGHACAYKGKTEDDVVEEACDVIQCAISVVAKMYEGREFPENKMRQWFSSKLDRWEVKQNAEAKEA